jgi:hypothetical protein
VEARLALVQGLLAVREHQENLVQAMVEVVAEVTVHQPLVLEVRVERHREVAAVVVHLELAQAEPGVREP